MASLLFTVNCAIKYGSLCYYMFYYSWSNTLDQKINFNAWTYEEDRTLWLAVQELGEG